MVERMDATIVKTSYNTLIKYIPLELPATGWYFVDELPSGSAVPEKRGHLGCMFAGIEKVFQGQSLAFSLENAGCYGASCYLGFTRPSKNAGSFLSETEGFKKNKMLGQAFYRTIEARKPQQKYLVVENLHDIDKLHTIQIINLWVRPIHLAGLVTLANYDRTSNENVIFPFSSGCQSIWTIPYQEQIKNEPRCVVGCIDPAIRKYLADDVLSFSVSVERFVEMTDCIEGSFLEKREWQTLITQRS